MNSNRFKAYLVISIIILGLHPPRAEPALCEIYHSQVIALEDHSETLYVLVDQDGKWLHEPVRFPIEGAYEDDLGDEYDVLVYYTDQGRSNLGVLFYKTGYFTGFLYHEVGILSEGLIAVSKHDEYFGYINENGQTVIPPRWDYAYEFENGKALVTYETLSEYVDVIIDKEGKIIELEPSYDDLR